MIADADGDGDGDGDGEATGRRTYTMGSKRRNKDRIVCIAGATYTHISTAVVCVYIEYCTYMRTIPLDSDDLPRPLDPNLCYSRTKQRPRHDTSPPLRPSLRPRSTTHDAPAQHAEHKRFADVRPKDGRERKEKVVERMRAP